MWVCVLKQKCVTCHIAAPPFLIQVKSISWDTNTEIDVWRWEQNIYPRWFFVVFSGFPSFKSTTLIGHFLPHSAVSQGKLLFTVQPHWIRDHSKFLLLKSAVSGHWFASRALNITHQLLRQVLFCKFAFVSEEQLKFFFFFFSSFFNFSSLGLWLAAHSLSLTKDITQAT